MLDNTPTGTSAPISSAKTATGLGVSIPFTILTKANGGLLSKRIEADAAGKPVPDGSACAMSAGKARRATASGTDATAAMQGLADVLNRLAPSQALALGSLRQGLPDTVEITTTGKENEARGLVSRTGRYFVHAPGVPALMLLDFDQKGMPASAGEQIKAAGGFWEALCKVCPALANAANVERPSTSAGIVNTLTGECSPGSGGMHVYVPIKDGADAKRALTVLHERLWLAGLGWFWVSDGGQILERSPVDCAVYGPERLVFEGAPEVVPPLAQDAAVRNATAWRGEVLDTRSLLLDLTAGERVKLEALKRAARATVEDEAASKKRVRVNKAARALVKQKNIPLTTALRTVEQRYHGVLLPDDVLAFDDQALDLVRVRDIIADPDRYIGETLADPVEGIAYGRGKAMVMQRQEDGEPFINSFAHGGCQYDIKLDAGAVEEAVRAAGKAEAINTLILLLPRAKVEADERDKLLEVTAGTANIGKRAVARRLAEEDRRAEAEAAKRRKQSLFDAFVRKDRQVLPAPKETDELGPTLDPLDELLAQSSRLDRLFRNSMGEAAGVEARAPSGLHTLASGMAGGAALPPPVEPLITVYSAPGLALRIEDEVAFVAEQRNGETQTVGLPRPFIEAFKRMPAGVSKLPVVSSIITAPVVMRDGSVLAGKGVDGELGVAFRIPPELLAVVPDRALITDKEVRDAYRLLADEWMADVATNPAGKAVMVAYLLSLMQRVILPERPLFMFSAGQRGSGKTTAVSMATVAALGRRPAAASWSSSEDERGKALFAAQREGVASIAFDNIPAGAALSCPHIERALTSPEATDRVLGHSVRQTVSTTAILSATGNNIAAVGDLASRTLVVRLEASRPDPENRPFRHADVLAWTMANRTRLLRAAYTILLGNPLLAIPAGQRQAETRFKVWWELIGAAVEHAAGLAGQPVKFADLSRANDAADEGVAAMGQVLMALSEAFPGGAAFSARDIGPKVAFGSSRDDFLDALATASGRAFPPHLLEPSPKLIAARLHILVGRPVEVNGQLMQLHAELDSHTKIKAYTVRLVK